MNKVAISEFKRDRQHETPQSGLKCEAQMLLKGEAQNPGKSVASRSYSLRSRANTDKESKQGLDDKYATAYSGSGNCISFGKCDESQVHSSSGINRSLSSVIQQDKHHSESLKESQPQFYNEDLDTVVEDCQYNVNNFFYTRLVSQTISQN